MKTNFVLLGVCLFFAAIGWQCTSTAISPNAVLGDWAAKSELQGSGRASAAGFVIGNVAYMGTGLDGNRQSLTDFWAYNPSNNAWTQKADFAGSARSEAVGFAAAGKGYIGTGVKGSGGNLLRDVYQYDPTMNTWKQVADFSGSARRSAVAFSLLVDDFIDSQGFVGLGYDGAEKQDIWRYKVATDTWTQVKNFGGSARVGAVSFVINNLAYIGTGSSQNTNQTDLWSYDANKDSWTQHQRIPSAVYSSAYGVGFAINNVGYIVSGANAAVRSVLAYDPGSDLWTTKTPLEGLERSKAVGFAIGTKGYVTTGQDGSAVLDDLWAFDPTIAPD